MRRAFHKLLKSAKIENGTKVLSRLPIPPRRLLELYPPFLFMGLRVTRLSKDYRELQVRVPLRWYFRNHHGTMFGGILSAVVDPLPALMCAEIFPGTLAWTKAMRIEFLWPTATALEVSVQISEAQVASIRGQLESGKKAVEEFAVELKNTQGRTVARAWNTVYLTHGKAGKEK